MTVKAKAKESIFWNIIRLQNKFDELTELLEATNWQHNYLQGIAFAKDLEIVAGNMMQLTILIEDTGSCEEFKAFKKEHCKPKEKEETEQFAKDSSECKNINPIFEKRRKLENTVFEQFLQVTQEKDELDAELQAGFEPLPGGYLQIVNISGLLDDCISRGELLERIIDECELWDEFGKWAADKPQEAENAGNESETENAEATV